MKALVLKDYCVFSHEDVADPQPGPDDVLVKVKACGICGSDVHGMDGSSGRRIPPIIMGHEAAGVIAEVGANVSGFSIGERVTFDSTIYCGKCFHCRHSQINLCDNRRVLGVSCRDYRQDGALAEYIAVPHRGLYRLPDGVTFEQATMVEPLSVALHAMRQTPVSPNDTAVVIGAGVIGLLVVQSLRAGGCGQIVAVDNRADRCEVARRAGADSALNPNAADVAAEVQALTSRRGADIVFEAVGIPATVKAAAACARKGGAVVLIGNVSETVELPLQAVVTRELSLFGSCASCGEYGAALEMIARQTVNVDALISAVALLAEGAAWFQRLYKQEPGLVKVILVP